MNIQDWAAIAGIAAIFVSGAAVILTWISRAFWSLTIQREKEENDKRFEALESRLDHLESCEEKNKFFRHNFDSVTKNLFNHITNEIKHLREMIELKFKHLEETKGSKDEK